MQIMYSIKAIRGHWCQRASVFDCNRDCRRQTLLVYKNNIKLQSIHIMDRVCANVIALRVLNYK